MNETNKTSAEIDKDLKALNNRYSKTRTIAKGVTPLSVIAAVEIADAVLRAFNVSIPKEYLYQAGIGFFGLVAAAVNAFKNSKK